MNKPSYLLDCSALIAMTTPSHVFAQAATEWATTNLGTFATCPITQGGLLRFYMREAASPTMPSALEVLRCVTDMSNHRFIPDDLPYMQIDPSKVVGHKQVTDAYLVALAKAHGCVLATLDRNLAALHPGDTVCLI